MMIRPTTILQTADDVIDALGGTGAVAALTGASIASVSNWRANGRLPPRTFLIVTAALTEIGATAPAALWSIDDPETKSSTLSRAV